MQRSRVWNTKIVDRRLFRVCSMKGDYRTPMTQAFLSLSLSLSLAFFFFLLLSPMIIHVRGARHDRQSILRNDTLPLPPFRSVDDDSTCQRVVSLFPAMETEREGKNDHALSVSTILNSTGEGFRIWGENGVGFCLWKTRGWEFKDWDLLKSVDEVFSWCFIFRDWYIIVVIIVFCNKIVS